MPYRHLTLEVKEYRGDFPLTAKDSAKRRRQRRRKLIQDARLRLTAPRLMGSGRARGGRRPQRVGSR